MERWQIGKYDSAAKDETGGDTLALTVKADRLNKGMLQFDEKPRDVVILDKESKPLPYKK